MFFNWETTRLFEYLPKVILPALWATLQMLFTSMILGLAIGFAVAIVLVLTGPHGLSPQKTVYRILNSAVDLIRSFPVIILIVAVTPLTRMIVGTSVGWQAAIVPLTIAVFPVAARLVENSLLEVNQSVITAARSFGASNMQIIFRIMMVEALPSISANITFITIQLLGSSTLAGAVGAGGLGAVALTYGYQRFDDVIMYTIVLVLCVIVLSIQHIGNYVYRKLR